LVPGWQNGLTKPWLQQSAPGGWVMPTATTVPLIVLLIVLWRVTRGELLSIILFVSVFGAASAVNIGGSGVPPWSLALAVGIALNFLSGFPRPCFIAGCNVIAVRLLLVFVCYAIWTGIAHPLLFHGIMVFSSHGGAQPLTWSTANLFQIIYLLAVVTVYLLALFSSRESLESAMTWYIRGCLVICFFAIYQLANAVFHVPYPSSILYSNPVYVIYPAYKINGLWRLNSTLTEASSMAFQLSVGIALQGWQVLTRPFRWRSSLSLALMVTLLLLTQSSTGYLSLIFILAVAGILYGSYILHCRGISKPIFLGLILFAIVGIIAFSTTPAFTLVEKEVNLVILEKKNSSSYRERTAGNVAAMQSAQETYFLGAGWGSLRCSGLGYMLIGNVGIPGFLLFIFFLVTLCLPLFSGRETSSRGGLYESSLFATVVSIFGAALAGAEPVSPILWVLFAAASAGPQVLPNRYTWRNVTYPRLNPLSASVAKDTAV
jgi:hypothetical protein